MKGLDWITDQDFHGDVWEFADWITQTEEGRKLGVTLDQSHCNQCLIEHARNAMVAAPGRWISAALPK